MNHFDALARSANSTLLKVNPDLHHAEKAVHGFLAQYSNFSGQQFYDVLAGDAQASLADLEALGNCLNGPDDKHLVKYGALALLSAVAWDYDPAAVERGVIDRNSSSAMSVLVNVMYQSDNRVGETAYRIATAIGDEKRDRSTEDIEMTLLTMSPHNVSDMSDQIEPEKEADTIKERVPITDDKLRRKVAEFPWIDTRYEDIDLDARLEKGVNGTDVLIVDLSGYSSHMKALLDDANRYFSESVFQSMELQQIARVLTGDQGGYVNPPSFRDPDLPDSYCAKSAGSNSNLRPLYIARIGEYQDKPVFARLGYSRTKQNQSKLSQILGYHRVRS